MLRRHTLPLLLSLVAALLVVLCSTLLALQGGDGGESSVLPKTSLSLQQLNGMASSSAAVVIPTSASDRKLQSTFSSQSSVPMPEPWNAGGLLVDSLEGIALGPPSTNEPQQQTPDTNHSIPPLQLMSSLNIDVRQTFSATWWQSAERLRVLPVERISFCEHAHFFAMYHGNGKEYRLTADWMDFAVEHLSRWWKGVAYDKATPNRVVNRGVDPSALTPSPPGGHYRNGYQRVLRNLVHYVIRVLSSSERRTMEPLQVTQQTLATVAYLPYNSGSHVERARRLTIVSLAATLASLIRHDMGRIVVLADVEDYDRTLSDIWPPVVRLLRAAAAAASTPRSLPTLHAEDLVANMENDTLHEHDIDLEETIIVQSTQLQLTSASTRKFHNMYGNQKMVPRSAVQLMHKALFGTPPQGENVTALAEWNVFQRKWLGASSSSDASNSTTRWKYVYLTEPDIILIARRHVLEQFQPLMDDNKVFTPHRLQPMPHEFDFRTSAPPSSGDDDDDDAGIPIDPPPQLYVPAVGNWSAVQHVTDACCERGYSRDPNALGGKCGSFWFGCGFGRAAKPEVLQTTRQTAVDRFIRLSPFRMAQYVEGTRLFHLAGTEAGRICIPRNVATEGPCPEVPRKGLA